MHFRATGPLIVILLAGLATAPIQSCSSEAPDDSAMSRQIPGPAQAPVATDSEQPGEASPEQLAELEAMLRNELEALGKDIERSSAAVPVSEDNRVFDLRGRVNRDEDGIFVDGTISMWWTEVLVGDYDMNGEVSISDLVPVSVYLNRPVDYVKEPDGPPVAWYPTGGSGFSPTTSNTWRRARVDGDHNGKILISDITPIAQHWGERQDGYNIYRRGPGEEEFSLLPDPLETSTLTVARSRSFIPGNGTSNAMGPVNFSFDDYTEQAGTYTYHVRAVDLQSGQEGPVSHQFSVSYSEKPVASFSLMPDPLNPDRVLIDASASHDPDGEITKYIVNYGNGISATYEDAGISYTYPESGDYLIELVVEDDSIRRSDPVSMPFSVVEAPVAIFSAVQQQDVVVPTLELDASASYDPDGSITEYRYSFWRKGEQIPVPEFVASEPVVSYEFAELGTEQFRIHLQVTDDDGASDLREEYFTPVQPVSFSLHISPREGMADLPVTLSLSGNGLDPLEDFTIDLDLDGDDSYDILAMQSYYVMHLYGDAGSFTPQARVRDRYGNVATDDDGELIVLSDDGSIRWRETQISVSPQASNAVSMAIVDGHPALSFAVDGAGFSSKVAFSRAEDPLGQLWNEPLQIDDATGYSPDSQEDRTQLRVIDGRPAVAYFRDAGPQEPAEFCYLRSLDQQGAQWPAPHVISNHSVGQTSSLSMLEIDGQAAIAYSERLADNQARPVYIRSVDPDGNNWHTPVVLEDFNGNEFPYELSLAIIGGQPAVSFESGGLSYVRATDATGLNWETPVRVALHGGWYNSLAELDGRPAVSYFRVGNLAGDDSDLYFKRADDAAGDEWPVLHYILDETGDVGRYSCMAVIDGIPSIAYMHSQSRSIMFIQALDAQGSSWDTPEVAISFGQSGEITLLDFDGRPAIAARSGYGGAVFAMKR